MIGPNNLPEGVSDNSVESEILSDSRPQDLRSGDPLKKRAEFNRGAFEDHIKDRDALERFLGLEDEQEAPEWSDPAQNPKADK